ncbi:MAG: hypothetical protein V7603_3603 [Micromonosporaceae bacterium]
MPTSPQYGEWARGQRPQGTVYGSRPPQPGTDTGAPAQEQPGQYQPGQFYAGPAASSLEYHSGGPGPLPLDGSGSLTGHILAQGRPDVPESKPRGSRTVIITLVTIAVLALAAALGAVLVLSGTI